MSPMGKALGPHGEDCSGGAAVEWVHVGRDGEERSPDCSPSPGASWPGSGPQRKTLHSLPWNPLTYGKLGITLRSVNDRPALPAGAVHAEQLVHSFRAEMGHMAGGPQEAAKGSPRRMGRA